MSYGTIGADIIQTSGANLAPVFKDLNNNVVGNVVSTDNLTKLSNLNTKQIAKAWVNFDGTLTGTITPSASYNVTSVTKNGTGDYTINFTNAMVDTSYCITGNGSGETSGGMGIQLLSSTRAAAPTLKSTTQVRILSNNTSSTSDVKDISVIVFGN